MSRKLGQIIAVRENTWMIRIPMGCDLQTKQRTYYNRTVSWLSAPSAEVSRKEDQRTRSQHREGRRKDSVGSISRSMAQDSEISDLQQDVRKLRESARKIYSPLAG